MNKVSILIYHMIVPEEVEKVANFYSVRKSMFIKQMGYLKDNNFNVISLDDFMEYKKEAKPIPPQTVVITFDDGHSSDYTIAYPILHEHGFKAEFFAAVGRLDTPGFMTWTQVKEMSAGGMSMQSHTMTHPDLSDISDIEISKELELSKSIIEEKTGLPVSYLAIPSGKYTDKVMMLAEKAGYRAVCTSKAGQNSIKDNPFYLKRVCIRNSTSLGTFESILNWNLSTIYFYKFLSYASNVVRKFTGDERFEKLKNKMIR